MPLVNVLIAPLASTVTRQGRFSTPMCAQLVSSAAQVTTERAPTSQAIPQVATPASARQEITAQLAILRSRRVQRRPTRSLIRQPSASPVPQVTIAKALRRSILARPAITARPVLMSWRPQPLPIPIWVTYAQLTTFVRPPLVCPGSAPMVPSRRARVSKSVIHATMATSALMVVQRPVARLTITVTAIPTTLLESFVITASTEKKV